jgi:C1A family cysteine protease
LFSCFLTLVYGDCAVTAPVWSNTHTVKGILYIPYAEIEEPFYAWYDGPSKRSRIDYYGDMVKTYQLSTSGPYGTSLKIAPVTTETETNARTCLQVNGTSEYTIEPQTILPDLTNFECTGEETISGILTEKWALTQTIGQKVNKYTMWLHYKDDPNNVGTKIAIPVRYEMNGYNSLLGSHYDHYYLDYDSFDSDPIPDDIFKLDSNMTCSAFPGPGDKHIYTFNPMAEFVHPAKTSHVDYEFNKFTRKHRKQYKNETDHALRKEIFRQNVRFIHSVNRQNKGFTLTVNHLADKNPAELKALRGRTYSGGYNGGAPFPYKNIQKEALPDQWDWRLYGAVTPVKDQSVCGSCWSFGTVGTVEGALFLKNGGNLIRLSQQALIDCSWGYGNNGCDGGEDFRAYQWMLKHGGIPTEADYGSYLGQDGYCHADKVPKVAKITGYINVTANDESALRMALFKQGPISVGIDASQRTFSFYSNGVYYEPKCGNKVDELDHAVLAVGYGTINGENYWLIKNSWSNYWGNDGYILMSSKENNCGVMTTPTYVTM